MENLLVMEKLDSIIFYSIDRAIRTYRQYAQEQIKKHGFSITVDQWLIIKCLIENPDITQGEMADRVFKDTASVTRILGLLVKAKYITRKVSRADRRRTSITVTDFGLATIEGVDQVVLRNREHALRGISNEEIAVAGSVMQRIMENCAKE